MTRNSSAKGTPHDLQFSLILIAYYLTLAAFVVASFFPNYRAWGISCFAFTPVWMRILFPTLAALIPVIFVIPSLPWAGGARTEGSIKAGGRVYAAYSIILIVVLGFLFYFLRARTHYLGDGYTLLANLASANPTVKPRELGEELVHGWVKGIIGGNSENTALAVYQTVSIAAGLLFVFTTTIFSRVLFDEFWKRVSFTLTLVSGGYALLFFGYVENYSLFCASIGLFTLTGLAVASRKWRAWWIIPPLALVIFFHTLGAAFAPAALYLLLVDTKIGSRIRGWSLVGKLAVSGSLIVLAVAVWVYFYSTDYFFHFAFLPLVADRFSFPGYTLLSLRHVADWLNLIFLLAPGLLIALASTLMIGVKRAFQSTGARFLLLAAVGSLGGAFVLDPKLGLPRDWDLFSIPGVPLAALGGVVIVSLAYEERRKVVAVALIVSLTIFGLIPRVYTAASPEAATMQVYDYIALDPLRSRSILFILEDQYEKAGDTLNLKAAAALRASIFPEERLDWQALQLVAADRIDEAKALADQVLSVNARYSDMWLIEGRYLMDHKRYDTALTLYRIADGLNPYSAAVLNELGRCYTYMGNYADAEKTLLRVAEIDTNYADAPFNLAYLYGAKGDVERFHKYLDIAAGKPTAPPELLKTVADYWISNRNFEKAAEVYRKALAKGLDSAIVRTMAEKYPELKGHL